MSTIIASNKTNNANLIESDKLHVSIIKVEAIDSEQENNSSVKIKYHIENKCDVNIDYFQVKAFLINSNGQIIKKEENKFEDLIAMGRGVDLELEMSDVQYSMIGCDPQTIIEVTAYNIVKSDIGQLVISDKPLEMSHLSSVELADDLYLLGLNIHKTIPDDDNEVKLIMNTFIKNYSSHQTPMIKFSAEIINKNTSSNIVTLKCESESMRFGLDAIDDYTYIDEKRLKNSKVKLNFMAYYKLDTVNTQYSGISTISNDQIKNKGEKFSCREIMYSLFSYTNEEFNDMDIAIEKDKWKEELESNSYSYPLLDGSIFDADNSAMSVEQGLPLDQDQIYVIPCYFYNQTNYKTNCKIDNTWKVKLVDTIGQLIPGRPMCGILDDQENLMDFECLSSRERVDTRVYVFDGFTLVGKYEFGYALKSIKQDIEKSRTKQ